MLDILKFKAPQQRDDIGKGRIEVKDVSITFGKGKSAYRATETTDITIEAGEFVCILGPSGCGKSTL
ncbi:ATP-binding cassette domain-containing protein, partial [Mameliella sp. AT18]